MRTSNCGGKRSGDAVDYLAAATGTITISPGSSEVILVFFYSSPPEWAAKAKD